MTLVTPRGSLDARMTPADSMATSVPAPMARPTAARASAGASLTPSPTISTRRPCRPVVDAVGGHRQAPAPLVQRADRVVLVLGQGLGEAVSDAELAA